MPYPRILTIQDISCVGQCSLTVALPVLSACGLETCVLPSAVLSTHTGGFTGYTFRDLTDDMPAILAHWKREGILFDGVYTGYLGSARQIGYVREILAAVRRPGAPAIVDPAMADNGKLYAGFDAAYVAEMRPLCADADYLLPNITEACLLTDTPWQETYDRAFADDLLARLDALGARCTVLTGVSLRAGRTAVTEPATSTPRRLRARSCAVWHRSRRHGSPPIIRSPASGRLPPSRGIGTARNSSRFCRCS